MSLTDSDQDLMWVRSKIGDLPADDRLDEIFDSDGIGTRELTALWVLENRLANLLAEPSSFAIPDQYSQSTTENIKQLRDQIAALRVEIESDVDGDGLLDPGVLSRDDYCGRR